MIKHLPKGRELPPSFKRVVLCDWFRKFSFKERLKIMLGYRSRLRLTMYCEHSPGKYQANLELETTTQLEPKTNAIPNRVEGQS